MRDGPPNSGKIFLDEFNTLFESLTTITGKLIVCGDFNYHIDRDSDVDGKRLLNLLDTYGLVQVVKEPTHRRRHILDLVIVRGNELGIKNIKFDHSVKSDHLCVHFTASIQVQKRYRKVVSYRKWRNVDSQEFSSYILRSCANFGIMSISESVDLYNSELTKLADKHAPVKSCTVTIHPESAWLNEDIRVAKRQRRKLERQYRKTKLEVHRQIHNQQCNKLAFLIEAAKCKFYKEAFSQATGQKEVFKVANRLFFKQKSLVFLLTCPSKTCMLDPLPTWLLKENVDSLLPILINMVNESLAEGVMPQQLKTGVVTPLIKKKKLDHELLKNYRPVSNLTFISKLIERIAATQFKDHMNSNGLHEVYQSAYRCFHSTETALVKVQNDIFMGTDKDGASILVLLDLSAAFDTIDHNVLLATLEGRFNVKGVVLKWFKSYISDRKQSLVIQGQMSLSSDLVFGWYSKSCATQTTESPEFSRKIDQQNKEN
ncbi:uncharacterized protein LOC124258099 [Haliotis rubra]|uniref:uncharacterized protein LOC124258099 n=1 Tax=Haliotis rubra TaxID=36100 RepID=UPI001EE51AB9|nr:uncharacterized protein LOC124258099 [Haliotis rubra]